MEWTTWIPSAIGLGQVSILVAVYVHIDKKFEAVNRRVDDTKSTFIDGLESSGRAFDQRILKNEEAADQRIANATDAFAHRIGESEERFDNRIESVNDRIGNMEGTFKNLRDALVPRRD